ncbi:MAG: YesL family protein [Lachnospiraceae bacterium]|nr:YesL family protein [Lachnospiraceae bacterium]
MKEFFSIEGPFMQFFAKLWDMIILSILFCVCCIPIVTFGVSYSALYYTMVKAVIPGEGHTIRTFFKGLRQNIKQGLGLGILFEAILVVLFFSLYVVFINDLGLLGRFFGIAFVISLILVMTLMAYAFPLAGRFHNSIGEILANSLLIAVGSWKETVSMFILEAVLLASMAFVLFVPFIVLFVPGVVVWMQAKMLEVLLIPYMREGGEDNETETV